MPDSAIARVEGLAGADWVLIDSGDIIVHVFRPEIREFYNSKRCGRRRISRTKRFTEPPCGMPGLDESLRYMPWAG